MKKILALILCLILCLGTISFAAAEEEKTTYTSGDYRYILLEDGTAEITDYTGKETKLTVPSELNGHTVSSIGDKAFCRCVSLTSVSIPDGVTSIGKNAFSGCEKLTLSVTAGSFAGQYAKNNDIPYIASTGTDRLPG